MTRAQTLVWGLAVAIGAGVGIPLGILLWHALR